MDEADGMADDASGITDANSERPDGKCGMNCFIYGMTDDNSGMATYGSGITDETDGMADSNSGIRCFSEGND